jgi:hypothetical protein
MAQEGRGKKSSLPGSFFEIDELDTHWGKDEATGVDLMREPSGHPNPESEVQASERPQAAPCSDPAALDLGEPGFDEALPLIHPDLEPLAAPAVPAAPDPKQKRTVPVRAAKRQPPKAQPAPPLELDLDVDVGAPDRPTAPGDPRLGEARDRYAMGDYSGALVIAEAILQSDASNDQAQRYVDNCRQVLQQMFSAKLGPLTQRPEVVVADDRLRWLSLDHRAGFLLSLIDGNSTVEELLDISGMPRFEALRTLCDLLDQNVITLVQR